MNRLKGNRCYLAGAIEQDDDRGVTWRTVITAILREMGVTALDPLNKPIDGITENPQYWERLRAGKYWDELAKEMKRIRCVDLRMVDVSDFIIANIDLSVFTVGTWEEIFLGNRQKKPILIRVRQGKSKCPSWLFGTIPHQMIFSYWIDLCDYLWDINSGKIINDFNRWFFFNLPPATGPPDPA